MNHAADIDEGRAFFDDEQQRRSAEARFLSQSNLTFPFSSGLLEVRKVTDIHLVGSLRPGIVESHHPFDFEEGYLEGMDPFPLTLRWTDYGRDTDWTV